MEPITLTFSQLVGMLRAAGGVLIWTEADMLADLPDQLVTMYRSEHDRTYKLVLEDKREADT